MALSGLLKSYDEIWKALIMPPRLDYALVELGPSHFTVKQYNIHRRDFKLKNKRGMLIECSYFEHLEPLQLLMPCVIYSHANGCNRIEALQHVEMILANQMNFFCFDFTGCGKSEGQYSSIGLYEQDDLEAVITYLCSLGNVGKIGIWGRSMGAVSILLYSSKDECKANCLVVDSSFKSFKSLVKDIAKNRASIPGFLAGGAYNLLKTTIKNKADFDLDDLKPIKIVHKIKIPGLFGHGNKDSLVPSTHAQYLYDKYGGIKQLAIFNGDHNSTRPNDFLFAVRDFFKKYLLPEKKNDPPPMFNNPFTSPRNLTNPNNMSSPGPKSMTNFNTITSPGPTNITNTNSISSPNTITSPNTIPNANTIANPNTIINPIIPTNPKPIVTSRNITSPRVFEKMLFHNPLGNRTGSQNNDKSNNSILNENFLEDNIQNEDNKPKLRQVGQQINDSDNINRIQAHYSSVDKKELVLKSSVNLSNDKEILGSTMSKLAQGSNNSSTKIGGVIPIKLPNKPCYTSRNCATEPNDGEDFALQGKFFRSPNMLYGINSNQKKISENKYPFFENSVKSKVFSVQNPKEVFETITNTKSSVNNDSKHVMYSDKKTKLENNELEEQGNRKHLTAFYAHEIATKTYGKQFSLGDPYLLGGNNNTYINGNQRNIQQGSSDTIIKLEGEYDDKRVDNKKELKKGISNNVYQEDHLNENVNNNNNNTCGSIQNSGNEIHSPLVNNKSNTKTEDIHQCNTSSIEKEPNNLNLKTFENLENLQNLNPSSATKIQDVQSNLGSNDKPMQILKSNKLKIDINLSEETYTASSSSSSGQNDLNNNDNMNGMKKLTSRNGIINLGPTEGSGIKNRFTPKAKTILSDLPISPTSKFNNQMGSNKNLNYFLKSSIDGKQQNSISASFVDFSNALNETGANNNIKDFKVSTSFNHEDDIMRNLSGNKKALLERTFTDKS